ncbi:MAG: DNA-protecting protein DprA [Gammaproteobacteria bacterium]|nr:DNA-protecting protein DprA [Gammaproteobacteria bacterium]
MDRHNLSAWLALSLAEGIGPATVLRLLEIFPHPRAIATASATQLRALGLSASSIQNLHHPDAARLETVLVWLQQPLTHVITLQDPEYPYLLRQISDPPPLLYVRGDPKVLNQTQLAVVGSRHPTPIGAENAQAFAEELARTGITITSGLAYGIDAAAHQGALHAGGTTIAVCGTGADRVYPAYHRGLLEKILAQGGAVVSEFPLGTPPLAGNFPRRNRLISGLSRGVLVVEATRQSGSLITARHALDQGREVYAIPGSIHNPQAKGCHELLRQGAKLVESRADILEDFPATFADNSGGYAAAAPSPAVADATTPSAVVLAGVDAAPTAVDHIIARSGLTPDAVCSILLQLELQGKVVMTAAGSYCRVHLKGG